MTHIDSTEISQTGKLSRFIEINNKRLKTIVTLTMWVNNKTI